MNDRITHDLVKRFPPVDIDRMTAVYRPTNPFSTRVCTLLHLKKYFKVDKLVDSYSFVTKVCLLGRIEFTNEDLVDSPIPVTVLLLYNGHIS